MSPIPQVTPSTTLRLTHRRPLPRIGVGQKSSAAELIGSGRFTGASQGARVLALVDTQMSRPPCPSGRFEAMKRLNPSGDWIGQPSTEGVFRSAWLPATSSIFCAVLQAEKCGPAATAAAAATSAKSAVQTTRITLVFDVLPLTIELLLSRSVWTPTRLR